MEITNTRINLVNNNKILAYASVTLNDCIVITGIRLYEGNKGKFIVFPSRRSKNNKNFDIVFPCKDELRKLILDEIEKQYMTEIIK